MFQSCRIHVQGNGKSNNVITPAGLNYKLYPSELPLIIKSRAYLITHLNYFLMHSVFLVRKKKRNGGRRSLLHPHTCPCFLERKPKFLDQSACCCSRSSVKISARFLGSLLIGIWSFEANRRARNKGRRLRLGWSWRASAPVPIEWIPEVKVFQLKEEMTTEWIGDWRTWQGTESAGLWECESKTSQVASHSFLIGEIDIHQSPTSSYSPLPSCSYKTVPGNWNQARTNPVIFWLSTTLRSSSQIPDLTATSCS